MYEVVFNTDGDVTIELLSDNNIIDVYDSMGRKVYSVQSNANIIEVGLSEQPAGLYLVVVRNDNGNSYKRVVKN